MDVPFIDIVLMSEGIVFIVMTVAIFCCLCLVIGGLIGRGLRVHAQQEKEDGVDDSIDTEIP